MTMTATWRLMANSPFDSGINILTPKFHIPTWGMASDYDSSHQKLSTDSYVIFGRDSRPQICFLQLNKKSHARAFLHLKRQLLPAHSLKLQPSFAPVCTFKRLFCAQESARCAVLASRKTQMLYRKHKKLSQNWVKRVQKKTLESRKACKGCINIWSKVTTHSMAHKTPKTPL